MTDFEDTQPVALPAHGLERWRKFVDTLGRNGVPNRLWYETEQIMVYCRRAHHVLGDLGVCSTFDLANIMVSDGLQHQGLFKAMVAALKRRADSLDVDCLYVENVQTEQFVQGLQRMGFVLAENPFDYGGMPSLYLNMRGKP